MNYIEKLNLQTEDVKEVENLEKHTIINNDPFSVNKYNGHTREFLPIGGEYDDVYKPVNNAPTFGISCSVSKELRNLKTSLDNKASKITVEEFGVVGDGVTDDTVNLQKAIDYASDNKLTLTTKSNKIFLTSSTLNITKNFYLDFSNAILKSSSEIALKIDIDSDNSIDTQSYIKGLTIDCENNLKGMSVKAKRVYLDNLYFKNITNVGLSIDGGYEVTVSKSNFGGKTPTNKAIVVNTTDIYITHCFGTDNNVFIENNGDGNIFESCHAWIYTPTILPNSIFIKFNVSGVANKCIADTYYIGFRCNATGTCRLTNNNFITHTTYYNSSIYDKAPTFIHFYNGTSAYKTTVCNNWVSFPKKSETGFEVDGYFYNIDKKYVYGQVFGNNGYNIGNVNLCKEILVNETNNISSKQSYVIRKNNRVILKGYFVYSDPIPSSDTIVFTIPEGFRPFQSFYSFAIIGGNIETLSNVCNAYINSNGTVTIKNTSGVQAWQGIINVEYDVWEADI